MLNFLLAVTIAYSQDTTFYDINWYETKRIEEATYYKVVWHDERNSDKVQVKVYYKLTGKPKFSASYSSYKNRIRDGKELRWFANGQLASEAEYVKGNLHGKIISYTEKGEIKRQDLYKDGDLVEGKSFGVGGHRVPHSSHEILPEFPGGIDKLIQYLVAEIKYPKKQRDKRMQGQVKISFFILEDGSVANIHIMESPHEDFSKEAIRVIKKMPKWKPGVIDNRIEVFDLLLPLDFTIQEL